MAVTCLSLLKYSVNSAGGALPRRALREAATGSSGVSRCVRLTSAVARPGKVELLRGKEIAVETK